MVGLLQTASVAFYPTHPHAGRPPPDGCPVGLTRSPQPRNGLGAMGDFFQSLSLQILDVSLIKSLSIYNLSPLRRHPLGRYHMNVDDRGIHVMVKPNLFQQHISRDL